MRMGALLQPVHLVLGLVLLCSSSLMICVVASEGHDRRVWRPTPEHPLPVSLVVEYKYSGLLGLNNILWRVVEGAAGGCHEIQQHQKKSGETTPPTFGVVILPPLRAELGRKQNVEMHQYSELFDLEHQQNYYMRHRNCYITDKVNFERLQKDGSLQLLEDVVPMTRRRSVFAQTELEIQHMYQGLELSKQLLDQLYEPCVTKLRRIFMKGENSYTAVHVRVEDDWMEYCKFGHEKYDSTQRWCFGADEIANITLATEEVRGRHNFVLLYAAEMFDPTYKLRTNDSLKTDPTKVWPQDVRVVNPVHIGCFDRDPGSKPWSYTQRSAVSLFLAADADTFIGTKRSSFYLGVARIRELARLNTGGHSTLAYDGGAPEYKHAVENFPKSHFSPWPEDDRVTSLIPRARGQHHQ